MKLLDGMPAAKSCKIAIAWRGIHGNPPSSKAIKFIINRLLSQPKYQAFDQSSALQAFRISPFLVRFHGHGMAWLRKDQSKSSKTLIPHDGGNNAHHRIGCGDESRIGFIAEVVVPDYRAKVKCCMNTWLQAYC